MRGKGEETFIRRWTKRKIQSAEPADVPQQADTETEGESQGPSAQESAGGRALTDADMPDIDSLDDASSYADFLSSGVSDDLRRKALRRLFHAAAFNARDGLDDYDEDFTTFEKLGDVVTADMRHRMEMEEARKRAESERADDSPVADGEERPADDEADIVMEDHGPDTSTEAPDSDGEPEPASDDQEEEDPRTADGAVQAAKSSGEPRV